jgi:hypothetical protein
MSASEVMLTGGHFQDSQGNVLAGGYLTFVLSQDSSVNDSQIAAGVEITVYLDAFGDVIVSPGQFLWGNDVLQPPNSYYRVTGYTSEGQTAYGPNSQQVVGTGTFDLGSWVPNTVISWFPSPQPLVLEVNGEPASSQTLLNITGSGVTDEGNGTIQISGGGGLSLVDIQTGVMSGTTTLNFSIPTTGMYLVNFVFNVTSTNSAGSLALTSSSTDQNGNSGGTQNIGSISPTVGGAMNGPYNFSLQSGSSLSLTVTFSGTVTSLTYIVSLVKMS